MKDQTTIAHTGLTPETLLTLAEAAAITHPNVGEWIIAAEKRKAQLVLGLHSVYDPSTWEDVVRIDFLAEVMSDPSNFGGERAAFEAAYLASYPGTGGMSEFKASMWRIVRYILEEEGELFRSNCNTNQPTNMPTLDFYRITEFYSVGETPRTVGNYTDRAVARQIANAIAGIRKLTFVCETSIQGEGFSARWVDHNGNLALTISTETLTIPKA